jgi:CubicO group peptidase (beta-lactamase class C family)
MSWWRRSRRLTVRLAAVGALLVVAAAGWLGLQALTIGVGYKAKMLCSGVFVSGRQPDAVLAEIEADDLAILRFIDSSIDRSGQATTTSALGVSRRARFRPGLGCTVLLDGLDPSSLLTETTLAHRSALDTALVEKSADGAGEAGVPDRLDAVIARAFEEPDAERPRHTKAVLVVHRGRVVGEQYASGITRETPLPGWSMTKSVTNALVGILVGSGRLSVDAPVPIAEWHQPDDPRRTITVDQLLHMSSGLRFDEGMSSVRADVVRMLFQSGDAAAFAIGKELVASPGTHWQYSSGTTNILSRALRTLFSSDAEYLSFPRRSLFDRIGMSSAVIETDAAGTFVGSSYMYATARDWARFGMLYAHDGTWNGERLLPQGWVKYSSSPAPADPLKQYGAHFWLQIPEGYGGSDRRLPVSAFHAAGHEGQFVTIVPSRDLVIVRLGRTLYAGAWDHAAFVREVLAALPE